jgi:hypothetical protein
MKFANFGSFSNSGDFVREHKSDLLSSLLRSASFNGSSVTTVDYGSSDNAQKPTGCDYVNFNEYRSSFFGMLNPYFLFVLFRIRSDLVRLYRAEGAVYSHGSLIKRVVRFLYKVNQCRKALRALDVDGVIVWNPHDSKHLIIKELCRLESVRFLAIEGGVVPGTIELDTFGHQFDGAIQRNLARFNSLKVSDVMLDLARDYLTFVRENRFSKKHQSYSKNLDGLRERNEKIIFLAGVAEGAIDMLSASEKDKSKCSPFYLRERELFRDLIQVARKEGYYIVYKPHPNSKFLPEAITAIDFDLDGHSIELDADVFDLIDLSDVMVTIGSTVSIHSMLQGKPVVLAGVNAFRGGGICHDLENREDLSGQIKKALSRVEFENQSRALVEFVARSMEYYSSPYSSYCEEFYGDSGEGLARRIQYILKNGKEF